MRRVCYARRAVMDTVHRAFDFDDVALTHDALRAVPDDPSFRERLLARAQRGPAPPCAAALLAEREDRRAAGTLLGLCAYLDAPDAPALLALDEPDALAVALAAPWVPTPLRSAAAQALRHARATPVALCVLGEIADGPSRPPRPDALAALDAMTLRVDEATRSAAAKLRARVKLARSWTGVRRQELQREVATGALHPVVGLLIGDGSFLATLVPPIDDAARAALVPSLLANARDTTGDHRRRTLALLHGGRFREHAREPLAALARFVRLRGRDAELPLLAVDALAAIGAARDLLAAVVSGTPDARLRALTALERLGARVHADVPDALLEDAVAALVQQGDGSLADRLGVLASR